MLKTFLLVLFSLSMAHPARAGVSVIVGKSNPVNSLSKDEIADIFLGTSKNFPNGNNALPCGHNADEIANAFYKTYANSTSKQAKAAWTKLIFTGRAKKPKIVIDDAAAIEYVNGTDGGICFVQGNGAGAKVVALK